MRRIVKRNVGQSQRAAVDGYQVLDVPCGVDLHTASTYGEVAVILIKTAVDDKIARTRLFQEGVQSVIDVRPLIGNARGNAVRIASRPLRSNGERCTFSNIEYSTGTTIQE